MPIFPFVRPTNAPMPVESLHYSIQFGGSPAGSSSYQRMDSGAISASSDLKIGAIELKETVTAMFKGAKLVSSDSSIQSPQGNSTIHYAGGKLHFHSQRGDKLLDYVPKLDFYGGNIIPALWSSSVAEADSQLSKHPDLNSVTVKTYLFDVGSELPVIYRRLPARKVTVAGKLEVASAFQANLGSVQAEIDRSKSGTIVGFEVPGQKIRMVLDGWGGLFEDPLAKYPELSQPTFEVKREGFVPMSTRDGVELVSTVVRPDAPGKFPTILARTPYDRDGGASDAEFYARRGYVYVSQDVRGRGASKGEWDPFVHEGPDGFDTIQWICKQPWSDGKVGMIGGSYVGYVQWAAAVEQPPGLKCIVPQVSPPDAMHNLPYEFGVPFLYADLWWAKIVAGKALDLSSFSGSLPHPDGMVTLPLENVDQAVLGQKIPFLKNWLSRTTEPEWKGFDFFKHLDKANVPALQISGWYDGDGIGTKLIWAEQRRLGKKNQWLIEGPWTHAFDTTSSIGKIDFGPSAIIELDSLYLRWFDTWLKGKSVKLEQVPKVKVFITGLNKWQVLEDWPSVTEKQETLYFSGSGNPKTRTLTPELPPNRAESYTYDPSKDTDVSPLKTTDSDLQSFDAVVDLGKKTNGGFYLYTTKPLQKDKVIAGPAVMRLNFSTSARDTDFFVTLVDVDEKGTLRVFSDPGKMRASYLGGVDRRVFLNPGKVYQVKIQPWEFAHRIKAGHRIGVYICSTLFPEFARNLGTDEPIATGTRMVPQHNTLFFGKSHPTSITFEVMQLP